jgi:DNA-binding FadR family transcriptional regulator
MQNLKRILSVPGDLGGIGRRTVRHQVGDGLFRSVHSGFLQSGEALPSECELA